jgi:hypothetical protein
VKRRGKSKPLTVRAPAPDAAHTAPADKSGRVVVRVATDTWIVFAIMYAIPLLLGVELLRERHPFIGFACVAAVIAIFGHYAFQRIVFDGESMFMWRPLFAGRPFPVREVTHVAVALRRQNGRPYWQVVLRSGETVRCRFNPRVYSTGGLDTIYEEIRFRSPNVEIRDDAYEIRRRGRA